MLHVISTQNIKSKLYYKTTGTIMTSTRGCKQCVSLFIVYLLFFLIMTTLSNEVFAKQIQIENGVT